MNDTELVDAAQNKALSIIRDHPHPELSYHNILHTNRVVQAVTEIGTHYHVSESELVILQIAAWFHDIGYYSDQPNGHESCGATIAVSFLEGEKVDPAIIAQVRGCILATQMPQAPHNLLEEIMCDADLYHLGCADFAECTKQLRKEQEIIKGQEITKEQWQAETIAFLEKHRYFTDYCRELLDGQKKKNIDTLQGKLRKNKNKDKKATDKMKPSKGIETMFRITSSNNQKLSALADNKAHILITVNSIILSAIISLLLRRLEQYPYLTIPTFITLGGSVTTTIFSILATRPHLPSGTFSEKDIQDKKVNLLFFGNFYRMNLTDYTEAMYALMDDYDYLYGSLIKDVYSQGVVLSHKYKLLRIAYNTFMFGLIISVLSFIMAIVFNH